MKGYAAIDYDFVLYSEVEKSIRYFQAKNCEELYLKDNYLVC